MRALGTRRKLVLYRSGQPTEPGTFLSPRTHVFLQSRAWRFWHQLCVCLLFLLLISDSSTPHAAACLFNLSVLFLRSILAPWEIPKCLRNLKESYLREGPSRVPTEVATATMGYQMPDGDWSWAPDEEKSVEEGLPQNKEYHGFHDTCAWIFFYLRNCSFHPRT